MLVQKIKCCLLLVRFWTCCRGLLNIWVFSSFISVAIQIYYVKLILKSGRSETKLYENHVHIRWIQVFLFKYLKKYFYNAQPSRFQVSDYVYVNNFFFFVCWTKFNFQKISFFPTKDARTSLREGFCNIPVWKLLV